MMCTAVPTAGSSPQQATAASQPPLKPDVKKGGEEAARSVRSLAANDMVQTASIEVTMMQVIPALGLLSIAPRLPSSFVLAVWLEGEG
jgi:hypothetical protein